MDFLSDGQISNAELRRIYARKAQGKYNMMENHLLDPTRSANFLFVLEEGKLPIVQILT